MSNQPVFLSATAGGVRIQVHAQPGASRSQIVGLHGEALKIKIKAPPEDGRANEELRRMLAETLNVPLSSVTLVRGASSRQKVIEVVGVDLASAAQLLAPN